METAPFSSPTTLPFLPPFPPSSSAEPTEEAPPEVQLPAVIPQAGGDDLLIGDLLSLDLPTGPSTAYNAPSGACVYLLTNLFAINRLCWWYIVSVCVSFRWLGRPRLSHGRAGWVAGKHHGCSHLLRVTPTTSPSSSLLLFSPPLFSSSFLLSSPLFSSSFLLFSPPLFSSCSLVVVWLARIPQGEDSSSQMSLWGEDSSSQVSLWGEDSSSQVSLWGEDSSSQVSPWGEEEGWD